MKIKIFEPPLNNLMAEGGEVKPRKMFLGGGFETGIADAITRANVINSVDSALEEPRATPVAGPTEVEPARDPRTPDPENPRPTTYDEPAIIEYATERFGIPEDPSREQLRPVASILYDADPIIDEAEAGVYGTDRYTNYSPIRTLETREQQIEETLDRLTREPAAYTAPAGDVSDDIARTIQEAIAEGTLTPDEIQSRIDAGDITRDDVAAIIAAGFNFTDEQFGQLFAAGVLTREEIEALVAQALADQASSAETEGLTEEQVGELISQRLEGYDPNVDLTSLATQEQLQNFATQDQLANFATQEDIAGLEGLFQNYLTPEQLKGYLPETGDFVTREELAAATENQYDEVIKGLTDKLGQLETKYQDVQSQYEADAVNEQINQTKEELDSFFRAAAPTGPRTGSTSQFKSGASFLPGGSPMANLIAGQRESFGEDPFSSYLRTFTPSYGDYEPPIDVEEYGRAGRPLLDIQYSNPFTGGASYKAASGGPTSNGIMDLTDFNTNVQPFQNAFRPNKPRN